MIRNGRDGRGAIGRAPGILQDEIIPTTQTDYSITRKELGDSVAIRSRSDLGIIEQYKMVATVPAFDHMASIAA